MNRKQCNHTSITSNCKSCQDLKNKWYAKLEDSGFSDIETNETTFSRSSRDVFKRFTKDEIDSRATYYIACESFLNSHSFRNELERIIWEYYSNGLGQVEISKILKKVNLTPNSRGSVGATLAKLKKIMAYEYFYNIPLSTNEH